MAILVEALSSIDRPIMTHDRRSTFHSNFGDTESLDSIGIAHPHYRATEIATQAGFHIFTSLLWIRTADQDLDRKLAVTDTDGTAESQAETSTISKPNKVLPDLGLLHLHRDRLAAAAAALQWRHIRALETTSAGLDFLHMNIEMYLNGLPTLHVGEVEHRKLRIMVNRAGRISVDSTVIGCETLRDLPTTLMTFLPTTLNLIDAEWPQVDKEVQLSNSMSQVFLDTHPSQPSLFTTHKTSHRSHYNRARERAGIAALPPTEKEVLLYNQNGEVMEASLCTVYFQRNNCWLTPAMICGGNLGVTRRLALEQGLCKQGSIEISEVKHGERIWLSNGARGFFPGQVCLGQSTSVADRMESVASL